MRFLPMLALAAVLAATGCTDIRAVDEASEDRREFPFTGERLVIDSGGADLRLVAGGGDAVEVRNDAPVRAVALSGDITATVRDSWLRVEDPGGALRLRAEFDVEVTGARSAEVIARSTDRGVSLTFAGPPSRVEARAAGAVEVALPGGPETYRVDASPGRAALRSDPASARVVTAVAGAGHTALVRKGA